MTPISSLLLVGIVVAGAFTFLAARSGAVPLPFGIEPPWVSSHAAPTSVLTLDTVYFEGAGTATSRTQEHQQDPARRWILPSVLSPADVLRDPVLEEAP